MKIVAFTTTRRDGDARNPIQLRKILAVRRVPGGLATAKQVHGTALQVVPKLSRPRQYQGIDGLLTAAPDQPLGIFTADCASIFLSVPSHGVVGLLHAGWRGVRGKILQKALRLMRRRWGCAPKQVRLWLGPSIGPCCFEVGWDAARYFPATRHKRGSQWQVNLAAELRRQARRLGIGQMGRSAAGCTKHQSRHYSFRRDQTEQRQISIIYGIAKKT